MSAIMRWISMDTEAGAKPGTGPQDDDTHWGQSPFSGVMTEFGAVELITKQSFHGVLWPSRPSDRNPAIPELLDGAQPFDNIAVMNGFVDWLHQFGAERLIFVSDNPGFDFMWMAFEFDRAGIKNPFGWSARRIGDFWAGSIGHWRDSSGWHKYRVTPHTHNPVDDAMGNAEGLEALLRSTDDWDEILKAANLSSSGQLESGQCG